MPLTLERSSKWELECRDPRKTDANVLYIISVNQFFHVPPTHAHLQCLKIQPLAHYCHCSYFKFSRLYQLVEPQKSLHGCQRVSFDADCKSHLLTYMADLMENHTSEKCEK